MMDDDDIDATHDGNRADGTLGNKASAIADETPPADAHPFDRLDQDRVIAAVESRGLLSDLRVFPLNSYENRVYQVGLEDADPVIAKIYRPERWRPEQIREEHAFTLELKAAELPVVAPLLFDGDSLFEHDGFWVALFPRQGGHPAEFDNFEHLEQMGRYLGRMHAVGAAGDFAHRPTLNLADWGEASVRYLLAEDWIPRDLLPAYESITADLLPQLREAFATPAPMIRLHGDCHAGNILWRDDAPHFVDFDDCLTGPPVQDLWMWLSGSRADRLAQLDAILEGYQQFHDFHPGQLRLIEALRTLRLLHYSAWLARRYHDPAFSRAFPWFRQARYWSDHVLELREQQAALQEPPLALM